MAAAISDVGNSMGWNTPRGKRARRNALGIAPNRVTNRLHDMWVGTMMTKWEFPPKPPRMRWRTYRRLKQQYDELQRRWMTGVMGRFGIIVMRTLP